MRYAESPAALAAGALALAGVLAGCADGSSSSTVAPSASTPSSASAPASSATTATTTATTGPTTEASPTAAPAATGRLITMDSFTVNAPEGWQVVDGADSEQAQAYLPSKPIGTLDLRSYADLGDLGSAYALKQAEAGAKTLLGHPATRAADRTVDGVDMFVLTGSNAAYADYYELVAVHEGYVSDITVFLNAKLDDPQGFVDAIVDSITFTTPPAS